MREPVTRISVAGSSLVAVGAAAVWAEAGGAAAIAKLTTAELASQYFMEFFIELIPLQLKYAPRSLS